MDGTQSVPGCIPTQTVRRGNDQLQEESFKHE